MTIHDEPEHLRLDAEREPLHRALKLLSACSMVLMHAQREQEFLDDICRLAIETGGYLMAWVGFVEHDAACSVLRRAQSGYDVGYLESVTISWSDDASGRGPVGTAIKTGTTVVNDDFGSNADMGPWIAAARQRGYGSSIALPLTVQQRVIGVFCAYSADSFAFSEPEVRLLEDLAGSMAYGIEAIRTRAEREAAQAALRKENEKNLALLRNASDGIHILDTMGNLIEASDAFCAMLGYRLDEMIGMNVAQWDAHFSESGLAQIVRKQFGDQGRCQFETCHRRKDGSLLDVEVSGCALELDGRSVLFNSSRDITERKQADAKIHHLAFFDALTQLPNRSLLMDRFVSALAASTRTSLYGAVLFIDMDRFKTVNDVFGHDFGDLLLIEVANRLQSSVREGDTVARWGGDEFVVLLTAIDEQIEAASHKTALIAAKIRASLTKPYLLKTIEQHCSSSIGVAMYRASGDTPDVVLRQADIAMYKAKDAGRNAVRFFNPEMQRAVEAHATLEADLRRAITEKQLRLYYQVQVDAEQRRMGAEALVRWDHPQRGMVSPMSFIPIAEESSLILDVGGWVLQAACRQLSAWQHQTRTRDFSLSVNVSAKQFRQIDFVDMLASLLREHAIDPARLKLELTESVVLNDIGDVVTKMRALKALGLKLSMDDFGTGYSSLAYLKRLPLDEIKIDQSFVRDIVSDPNDAVMVKTIIDLGVNFGLGVIAEGVETEAQLSFLQRHGCIAYQGYLFSKPVPIGDFEAFLQQHEATAPLHLPDASN